MLTEKRTEARKPEEFGNQLERHGEKSRPTRDHCFNVKKVIQTVYLLASGVGCCFKNIFTST